MEDSLTNSLNYFSQLHIYNGISSFLSAINKEAIAKSIGG